MCFLLCPYTVVTVVVILLLDELELVFSFRRLVKYFVYLVLNRTDCLARQRYTKRVSSLARALNKPRSGSWLADLVCI